MSTADLTNATKYRSNRAIYTTPGIAKFAHCCKSQCGYMPSEQSNQFVYLPPAGYNASQDYSDIFHDE